MGEKDYTRVRDAVFPLGEPNVPRRQPKTPLHGSFCVPLGQHFLHCTATYLTIFLNDIASFNCGTFILFFFQSTLTHDNQHLCSYIASLHEEDCNVQSASRLDLLFFLQCSNTTALHLSSQLIFLVIVWVGCSVLQRALNRRATTCPHSAVHQWLHFVDAQVPFCKKMMCYFGSVQFEVLKSI